MPPYENRPGWGKTGERMKSDIEALRQALAGLLEYAERNECHHEETHRGGAIWTICDGCGRKWSDDRDPFTPYREPKAISDARAAASPDRIARLLDALELAQRDAERYRFLNRDFSVMGANIDGNHSWAYRRNFSLRGPTLDAAIDEAMKERP